MLCRRLWRIFRTVSRRKCHIARRSTGSHHLQHVRENDIKKNRPGNTSHKRRGTTLNGLNSTFSGALMQLVNVYCLVCVDIITNINLKERVHSRRLFFIVVGFQRSVC